MLRGIMHIVLLLGAVAVAAPLCGAAQPPAPVTIEIAGGGTFTGLVDSRTDDQRLWLRFEKGSATAWRPFRWQQIVAANFQGRGVAAGDLRELARQIQSSRQKVVQPQRQPPAAEPAPRPAAPAALAIDASLANWDGDVETDGLAIDLTLLDADGFATAAAGTLEVELFAPRIRKYHEAPQSRGYSVDLIERWSLPLAKEKFRGGSLRIRLPFGAIHPEFDRSVDAVGLVHVRLAVPGHGVFEQSVDGVVLRPWSPTRDALLDNTGRQFLPTESTGRGEGAYPQPRY
jgi:hypothetical protein